MPNAEIRGTAHKFPAHVDTDAIIPARYLTSSDPAELARHCMEDIDPAFASRVRAGDIVVAGADFGCGSSREHAPMALKAAGVACVVAASFARIFFRNAINTALPILECPAAAEGIRAGDEVRIDLAGGRLEDLTTGETFAAEPFPAFMRDLVAAGGLAAWAATRRTEDAP